MNNNSESRDNRVFGLTPVPSKFEMPANSGHQESSTKTIKIVTQQDHSTKFQQHQQPQQNLHQTHQEHQRQQNLYSNNNNNQQQQPRSGSSLSQQEYAEKEAYLASEVQNFQARPYSPYQVPPKIDLSNETHAIQAQWQASELSSRPTSRASSTRAATIERDLLLNEAKLMREIEEMERKPYSPQRLLLDQEGTSIARDGLNSRASIRSMSPLDFQQHSNIHQQAQFADINNNNNNINNNNNNYNYSNRAAGVASPLSVHTAIVRRPPGEIDNKAPLPFAFDNFTTKGIRGNISTVGAVEPDRPRAPIYPIVKRSPTPGLDHSFN